MVSHTPKPEKRVSAPPASNSELAILEAAEYLFSEHGYDAVSMSAIAQRAATSKPNIYHHFESKHYLYLAVLNRAAEHSDELLDKLEDEPGTLQSKLAAFANGQLESILTHERRSKLILREALSGGSKRSREVANHVVGKSFARLVEMINQGQIRGEFRTGVDPAMAAFLIFSSNIFFFQSSAVMPHLPDISFTGDAEVFSTAMMDIMFNGVLQSKEEQE